MLVDIAYASEVAAQASETVTESGVLGSLGINGTLFIFQLVNFAIVVAVLWFLILKPLTKKMTERQKMIDDSVDNAKKIETNLGMSERKYQEKIDQAKVDANKFIEKAQQEAAQVAESMKEKSKIRTIGRNCQKKYQNRTGRVNKRIKTECRRANYCSCRKNIICKNRRRQR